MYIVSLCEQNYLFNLHNKAPSGLFEHYKFTYDGDNKITNALPANPVQSLTIWGYLSKKSNLKDGYNIYYGEHFAITEVNDDLANHLLAEWGTSSPLFTSGLIFVEKKETEARAKALAKLSNGANSINTGSRFLSINEHVKKLGNNYDFPNASTNEIRVY